MRILVNTIITKKGAGGAFQISYNFLLKTLDHSEIEWYYITSSDLEEGGMKLRKPNGDEFREEGGETVTITVEPGETGFFGLSAAGLIVSVKLSADKVTSVNGFNCPDWTWLWIIIVAILFIPLFLYPVLLT